MAKTKTKKRKKATPQELEKRAHRSDIRSVFNKAGFTKVLSVSDKEFTFKSATSDFDDVFVYENVIVFTEYTLTQSSNISGHLKPKKIVYDTIQSDPTGFLEFYEEKFPKFKETRGDFYDHDQCKIVILYCSKNSINPKHKELVPDIKYFDYPSVKYFKSVTDAVKKSACFELLSFLGLSNEDVGSESLSTASPLENFNGSVLPHTHSNFDKGYKVVSFYIKPSSLLKRSYVLRRDGWRDEGGLYQRMISSTKINAIRKYLNVEERVFINNIIVTLPSTTKIVDDQGNTVDHTKITKTEPVTIQIPNGFNVVGIIDGQHRVYAYHQGGDFEEKIARLREKQNLLVTGIIYPDKVKEIDKTKFEANLFLEINSTQTNAKSDLKQAIGLLLRPFSSDSIAKATINRLNNQGVLEDLFERHFYDKNKIKTTSIVSYGLKPIVKLSGNDSLYSIWDNENKEDLLKGDDLDLLHLYIDFCSDKINEFISAIKQKSDSSKWSTDPDVKGRVLTTTAINGFIICLRKIIENNKKVLSRENYVKKLNGLDKFDFSTYKSSQYGSMGRDLYDKFFSK